MRFLIERKQTQQFANLLDAKNNLESQQQVKYINLTDDEKTEFIQQCIDSVPNSNILKNLRLPIVKSLKESEFGKNRDVIKYFDELNNTQVTEDIASLVSQLILNGSMKYTNARRWLNNSSLYDRSNEDILYTIKAMTLADNPDLQKTKGNQELFKDGLSIRNLMNKGEVFSASRIQSILNGKQSYEDPNAKRKSELEDILKNQLGIPKPKPWVDKYFEEDKDIEYIIGKILMNYQKQ